MNPKVSMTNIFQCIIHEINTGSRWSQLFFEIDSVKIINKTVATNEIKATIDSKLLATIFYETYMEYERPKKGTIVNSDNYPHYDISNKNYLEAWKTKSL